MGLAPPLFQFFFLLPFCPLPNGVTRSPASFGSTLHEQFVAKDTTLGGVLSGANINIVADYLTRQFTSNKLLRA